MTESQQLLLHLLHHLQLRLLLILLLERNDNKNSNKNDDDDGSGNQNHTHTQYINKHKHLSRLVLKSQDAPRILYFKLGSHLQFRHNFAPEQLENGTSSGHGTQPGEINDIWGMNGIDGKGQIWREIARVSRKKVTKANFSEKRLVLSESPPLAGIQNLIWGGGNYRLLKVARFGEKKVRFRLENVQICREKRKVWGVVRFGGNWKMSRFCDATNHIKV